MDQTSSRVRWIDYLRGGIILLVVAHHSSLAYTSFASFHKEAYILSTHPVVDPTRSVILDYFEDFNDVFFMSLMFLISGIFAMRGLENKGRKGYLRDRFFRLMVPFLLGVTILMPLAYYPAWIQAHGAGNIRAYMIDFFTVEAWPVGPPWFLWVLFLFDLAFAWMYPYCKQFFQWACSAFPTVRTGMEILLQVYIMTWILYIPLMLWTGPDKWTGFGPFDFQVSRLLLYFGYFLLGVIVGGMGRIDSIFPLDGVFMRKWPFWVAGSLGAYLSMKGSVYPLRWLVEKGTIGMARAEWLYRSAWCLCCALGCMAMLSIFRRFFSRPSRWLDSLAGNAFNIYLLHYIFVVWCQWFLLDLAWPALVKFGVTTIVSIVFSWGLSIAIQQIRSNGVPLRLWYTKS